MLNKLIFANLTHRPVRTLLSVLAIAVEVTMILTLVGVSHGTLDSTAQRARGVGADLVIRPQNSAVLSSLSSAPISEKMVGWAMTQPHIVLASGVVIHSLTFPDSVTGLDFPSFNKMSGGFEYDSGGDPVNDNDMAVDKYYAQQKNLHVGSKFSLIDHDWNISGIYEGGKLARIVVKLSALQTVMESPGHVTVIYAKLDDPKLAPQVVDDLKAKLPGYPILTMDELTSMYSISNIGMLKDFIGVVIGVAVIVGFIVVFMAMYTAVLERTREIGIIKAVGGSSGLVLNILLRETLLLAILGSLVGIAMTYGTQWLMQHSVPASLVQETVYLWWAYAAAIAIVGAMLGVIVPGVKAVKQDVTEALSYE
ncbi:MAG TPA: FtsX-like permease family protein [Acidobacteriaceae bacterium]|nr:FtsX-like permease family protein [Acidobacteriaceae bacterium]